MRIIVVFFVLCTSTVLAADIDQGMKETVNAFYHVYLTVRSSGVPSAQEQLKFRPYLSASLRQLLKRAAMAERAYYGSTKGEVPPLAEGDIFTSLFEGASSFTVLSCSTKTRSCLAELSYVDPGNKSSSTTWRDKIYLIRNSHGWLVDDIEFLGTWQFMHRGRLKELLNQVISEGS
jgi:hypothetical protein